MPIPAGVLLGAGLAAMAAGAGLQAAAAAAQRRAANRALSYIAQQQRRLQPAAEQIYQQQLSRVAPQAALPALAAFQKQREAAYRQIESIPLSSQPPVATTGSLVDATRSVAANTLERLNQARLLGYSDWEVDNLVWTALTNARLGLVSDLARMYGALAEPLLQEASGAGAGLATAGGILSAVGQVGATFGALKR